MGIALRNPQLGAGFLPRQIIVTSPRTDHVRDLRSCIDDLTTLRFNLAHELAHTQIDGTFTLPLDHPDPDQAGATYLVQVKYNDDGSAAVGTALAFPDDSESAAAWSRLITAPVQMVDHTQSCGEFRSALPLGAVFPMLAGLESIVALVRLLDGILAALGLMLVLVLAALRRHPDVLNFVLVMLAACFHFGQRGEPDDHAILPMRRYQTSLGSCLDG